MRKGRKYHKTHLTRPRKSPGAKRRRQLEHRRRLVALGVPEEEVAGMNAREIRTLLKRPAKVQKQYATGGAEQS